MAVTVSLDQVTTSTLSASDCISNHDALVCAVGRAKKDGYFEPKYQDFDSVPAVSLEYSVGDGVDHF